MATIFDFIWLCKMIYKDKAMMESLLLIGHTLYLALQGVFVTDGMQFENPISLFLFHSSLCI